MTNNKIDKQLNEIKNKIESLSDLEQENLVLDLYAINERIQSGNYKYTDFVNRNIYDITQRTREFFTYFKSYYRFAKTWESILSTFPLEDINVIIDLCPGWAPKLEMSLCYLNYSGTVRLIDKHNESLIHLDDALEMFNPRFTIEKMASDFYFYQYSAEKLVIANHIIDDLLIDYYCKLKNVALQEVYETESVFLKVIDDIYKIMNSNYSDFVSKLAESLSPYVACGGYLLLTQYSSMSEVNHSIKNWSEFCSIIFKELQQRLLTQNFTDITSKHIFKLAKMDKEYFGEKDLIVLERI